MAEAQQIQVVVREQNIEPASAASLMESFGPMYEEASSLVEIAKTINVTDPTQVTEIRDAREVRLALKKIRTKCENRRKELKEDALRYGRAVDGVANVIKLMTEPAERRLMDMEKIAERIEAERKAKIAEERSEELRRFQMDPSHFNLGEMSEEEWESIRDGAETAYNKRLEQERIRKEEAEAKAKADAEERERIRAENERLRAERAEQDKKLRAEREAREKIEAEARAARAKAEAEEKAAKAAEERRKAEEEKARRRAEQMDDREKVREYVDRLLAVETPSVSSPDVVFALRAIGDCLEKVKEEMK